MKFVFNNHIILTIDKDKMECIDDDNEAFYIEGKNYNYTIYKKDILYIVYDK